LILGTEGKEFIVSNEKGIYKTNEQIITSKVSTEVGKAATTVVRSITFNDVQALATLQELRTAYKDAEIFLSGELAVDFPEDIKIPIEPNQMVTASVVGSSIKLNYCSLEKAIAYLREQYAVGSVEVKILRL
jgi:inner membrane protein